jgi:flavin-dependent dehydrogenase
VSFITVDAASKAPYDVIVVGSGAAGGQTAYTLARFDGPPAKVLRKAGLL